MCKSVKMFSSSQRQAGLARRQVNRPGCLPRSSAGSVRLLLSCPAQQVSQALLQRLPKCPALQV